MPGALVLGYWFLWSDSSATHQDVKLDPVINAAWHKTHRMPMPSTLDQRVDWHLAHAKACGCRTTLPPTIVAELKRRGLKAPAPAKRIAKKR